MAKSVKSHNNTTITQQYHMVLWHYPDQITIVNSAHEVWWWTENPDADLLYFTASESWYYTKFKLPGNQTLNMVNIGDIDHRIII